MLRLVCLNRLVTFLIKGLWYMNNIHFVSSPCVICCLSPRGFFLLLGDNFSDYEWYV